MEFTFGGGGGGGGRERQTDRQTDRQTETETERQICSFYTFFIQRFVFQYANSMEFIVSIKERVRVNEIEFANSIELFSRSTC